MCIFLAHCKRIEKSLQYYLIFYCFVKFFHLNQIKKECCIYNFAMIYTRNG